MAAISELCRRGLVLDTGKLIFDGSAKRPSTSYQHDFPHAKLSESHHRLGSPRPPFPSGKFLQAIELYTDHGQPVLRGIPVGGSLKVRVHFSLPHPTQRLMWVWDSIILSGSDSLPRTRYLSPVWITRSLSVRRCVVCEIPSLTLLPGDYVLRVWLDIGKVEADLIDSAARIKVLESDYYGSGKLPNDGASFLNNTGRSAKLVKSGPPARAPLRISCVDRASFAKVVLDEDKLPMYALTVVQRAE